MNWRTIAGFAVLAGLLCALPCAMAVAQSSANYKLEEGLLNSGGNPAGGVTLSSASYRIKLDAIGESAMMAGLSGPSFHMDAGFVSRNSPPLEVSGLEFTDDTTLQWNAGPAADRYQVYRATSLPGTFGTCFDSELLPTTGDTSIPTLNSALIYFVTERNRLREEGTKGFLSDGTERGNPLPCP